MDIFARGIDVSEHQGEIDFNAVKNDGVDFVIIRAGYGIGHIDRNFYANYTNAKAAGLDVGAYWYSYATDTDFCRQEAQSFIDTVKGCQFEFPLYFDIEEQKQISQGKEFCSGLIQTFCDYLEKNGYFSGFYSYLGMISSVVNDCIKSRYTCWVAQWSSNCSYTGDYGLWQYSATGNIDGIQTDVDCNYCYVDYPGLIKKLQLNGFYGYDKLKTVEEVAQEVLSGKWNVGEERRKLLEAAGYNYNLVQDEVNRICANHSKTYVVQTGDTIESILNKFNISIEKFVSLNYKLKAGDTIRIEE